MLHKVLFSSTTDCNKENTWIKYLWNIKMELPALKLNKTEWNKDNKLIYQM